MEEMVELSATAMMLVAGGTGYPTAAALPMLGTCPDTSAGVPPNPPPR